MSYLAWRVMNGLHHDIELNFLVAGHTKFTPELCFGLVKKTFQRTRVSSLDDIAKVTVVFSSHLLTSFTSTVSNN